MKNNEKTQLLFRKIKQLNIVINGLTKENNERDKQIVLLKNKYDSQLDSILTTYSKKMERMLKSFIGQQQYFMNLFNPNFQYQVNSLKTKLIEAFQFINSILDSYEKPLFILNTQLKNLTLYISDLLIEEDLVFEQISESFTNAFEESRKLYLQKQRNINQKYQNQYNQLIKQHNQKVDQYSKFFSNSYPIDKTIYLYRMQRIKDLKANLSYLNESINDHREEIKGILRIHSGKSREYHQKMNTLIYDLNRENIQFKKEQIKLQTQISKLSSSINRSIGHFFGKIIFNKPKNKHEEPAFTAKVSNESDLTNLKTLLDDLKRNNQREVFELQFSQSNEKNAHLKIHSELLSLLKCILDGDECTKQLENEYLQYQSFCQNEISALQNQLDSEFSSRRKEIETKSQVKLSITAQNVFNKEARKYEEEFHQLTLQLTPQNKKERRQFLRADAILPFVEEIEYENTRHSLQMFLYDLHKSSRLTINNQKMNSLNAINLLREEIKREIERNQEKEKSKKGTNEKEFHRVFSSSIKFSQSDVNEEKARIARRMVKTSEGARRSSNDLLKKHGKERAKLLESYESIIQDLLNQKANIKLEMAQDSNKFEETMTTMRYKYFSFVETYQQLINTEKAEQNKKLNSIALEYDEKINQLKKAIERFKTDVNQANPKIEAQIDKLNWKCELLNSQLVALTRQLRSVHRNQMISKNPSGEISKLQKRIKSSLSVVQNNQVPR